jgi:hypothetical protein
MPQFDLQIRDIYGGVVGTWKPLDAELSVTQNETGSITGGFGRSDPTVTRNFFGPYRNDWFFYRDNRLLKSGPITNAGWSDQSEGMITMAGKTWEHLLDRRIWYFDPQEPDFETLISKYIYRSGVPVYPADKKPLLWPLHKIVRDLLDNVELHGNLGDPAYNLSGTTPGAIMEYEIFPFDTTPIMQHIKTISEQDIGFDFDIKYFAPLQLNFILHAPIKESSGITYALDRTNVTSLSFSNDGPVGTRNYVIGDGSLGTNWGFIDEYIPSSDRFRTLESVTRFGRIKDLDALQSLAKSEKARTKEPTLTVSVTVYPDTIPNFWAKLDTGIRVTLDYDFGFHNLNSDPDDSGSFTFWRVKGYTLNITRQGDPTVTLDMSRVPG